ncbi:DMT family transporter [Candidatus Daviesbacteria bacterium]|nr:DMT family transporter [Candidatus Daviesbacteria bacterium]
MTSAIFTKPWPYLALILANVIWGGNFVVAKITLQEFPIFSLAFFRFALAALLLAPFFWTATPLGGKKIEIDKKDLPRLVATGVLIITLNVTFFFAGIQKTTAINASVLTLIIPLISVLLGWWFLHEHIYLINILGVVLGLGGAIIIIGLPQIFLGSFSPTVLMGNLLIILASISWVWGAVLSRQLLTKYPSLTVTAFAFGVGAVTFLVPAINEYLQNPGWPDKVSMLGILGLTYMILLSSISAYFLFEWGLSRTSVSKANLFQYLEPFVATGLALLVLGEVISMPFLVGAVLIAVGVYWGTLAKETHHHHKIHRH